MRRLWILAAFTFLTISTFAQNTAVTLAVTDGDGQTWNNGTYQAQLQAQSSGSNPLTSQVFTGNLNGSGGATFTVPSSPIGFVYAFTVCPQAAPTPCFTQTSTISGPTQTVNIAPPAIRINIAGIPFKILAYQDVELLNPPLGSVYFNLNGAVQKVWNGTVWTTSGTSGVASVNGTANQIASSGGSNPVLSLTSPLQPPGQIQAPNGSCGAPAFSFSGANSTGMLNVAGPVLEFCTSNTLGLAQSNAAISSNLAHYFQNAVMAASQSQIPCINTTSIAGFTTIVPCPNPGIGTTLGFTSGSAAQWASSYQVIDDNLFVAADPCAQVIAATAQYPHAIHSAVGIGNGAGGDLTPCSQANSENFLSNLVGGRIYFGVYHWYLNTGVQMPQTNGYPPGGTVIIPNKIGGIFGAGGWSDFSINNGTTFIACQGLNNPVSGCLAPPIRHYPIATTSVANVGGSGRNYVTVNATAYNVTTVSCSAGSCTYSGAANSFPFCASNGCLNLDFTTAGLTNSVNNGTFIVTSSTNTGITVVNKAGVNATVQSGTATLLMRVNSDNPVLTVTSVANASAGCTTYTISSSLGASGNLNNYQWIFSGFTNAANNGKFTATQSAPNCGSTTGTTISVNNANGVAETPSGATATFSTIIQAGEPVRIEGSGTANNNGAWRICSTGNSDNTVTDPNCANPSDTAVVFVGTVANSTLGSVASTACASGCGNIHAGLPMFDGGTNGTGANAGSNAFGYQMQSMHIEACGVADVVGYRGLFINELAGLHMMQITGSPERNIDIHGQISQNADVFGPLNIGSGNCPTNPVTWCTVGTAAAFFAENGPHGMDQWTANMGNCQHTTPTAAIYDDTNTQQSKISNGHAEHVGYAVLWGQDSAANGWEADTTWGSSTNCGDTGVCHPQTAGVADGAYTGGSFLSATHGISNNYASSNGDYQLLNTRSHTDGTPGTQNAINDGVMAAATGNLTQVTDVVLELWSVDNNQGGSGCTSLQTTSTVFGPILCAGITFAGGNILGPNAAGILYSPATPTISSGFGTTPTVTRSNGSFTMRINVGTGGTATTGVIAMNATAPNGWNCWVYNITAHGANRTDDTVETASTNTTVTVQNQTNGHGTALAWTASDVIVLGCIANGN